MRSHPLARRMILAPALKISLLQNGQEFASIINAQAESALARSASAMVTAVKVTSPTQATVTYDILIGGKPALSDQTGTAAYQDGTWKVGDGSFYRLLALEGRSSAGSWWECGAGGASSGSTWRSGWPPWSSRRSSCRKAPTPPRRGWTPRGPCWALGRVAAFVLRDHQLRELVGFGSAEVISLLCVSAVLLVAFIWRERRAELSAAGPCGSCGVPASSHTSNIVAFCELTSSIVPPLFFFTALYLARGGRGVRLPAGGGVPADDGADDRLLGCWLGRCGRYARAALVDHDRLPGCSPPGLLR